MNISPQNPQVQSPVPDVMTDRNIMSEILKHLKAKELGNISAASKLCRQEASAELRAKRLDQLNKLKERQIISEELFSELSKDTFLKSLTPIKFETFFKSLEEIETKINTQIETQPRTNPEINTEKLNELKNKCLESLILNPNIIKTIDPEKIGLLTTSNDYYLGEIENEKANGYGVHTDADGNRYVGEWQAGQRHGQGTFTYESGEKYVGAWQNGKAHGQGTLSDKNGNVIYEGEWEEDKCHGQGILSYRNGNRYEGEFKENKRHGQGILSDRNGNVIYTGKWENGKAHGQ